MKMKITLIPWLAALLLFAAAATPLPAQTTAGSQTNNNTASTAPATPAEPDSPAAPAEPSPSGRRATSDGYVDPIPEIFKSLIPICGIICGCSIPVFIIGLMVYSQHRKTRQMHETVRAMVEKGVPIPPEMFKNVESEIVGNLLGKPREKLPRNDLRTGIIMLGLGVGVVMFLGKPGWIVVFLGLAFLVVAVLEKKNNHNVPPQV